ncbi:MAG: hypothetical protein AAGB93_04345 [Planctomycetota bacterium]
MSESNGKDPLGEEDGSGFDIREVVVYGLGRSRYTVGFLAVLGLTVGLVVAASIPNSYSATASLRYTPGLRERQFAPEASMGVDVQGVAPSIMAELMLIDDPSVFRAAAEELGASDVLIPADPTQYDDESTGVVTRSLHGLQKKMLELRGVPESIVDSPVAMEAAARALQDRTTFSPVRQSSVIRVTHSSSTKDRAVRSLELILDACVERHREQYRTHERLESSRAREADLYSSLQTARMEFREYRGECGVENIDRELDQVLSRIDSLETRISDTDTEISSNEAELEFLRERIAGVERVTQVAVPAVRAENPEYNGHMADRRQASLALAMLDRNASLSFAEKERQRSELEARLQYFDGKLQEVPRFIVQKPEGTESVENEAYVELDREVRRIEATQRSARTRLEKLNADLGEARQGLEHVRNCEEVYSQMQEVVEDFDRQFESVSTQNEQLESLLRLDEAGAANLSIYTSPRSPNGKDGPQRGKLALLGLLGGLAVGGAIAVARQLMEARVRYPRTVEREFGFPVLATVPELRNLRRLRGEIKAS